MKQFEFKCTGCHQVQPSDSWNHPCPHCGEPVEIGLDFADLTEERLRAVFDGQVRHGLLGKYAPLLPFSEEDSLINLGEGGTPLIAADTVGKRFGKVRLYLKNETANPTGSFKDRGTVSGIQRAINAGIEKVGTVSTGNMATSTAAFAARAGLSCLVLVKGNIKQEKLPPIAVYGPEMYRVDGNYGELYHKSLEIGTETGIYFIISDDPYREEGAKTVAFEIYEQLALQAPDYVLVPLSSGGHMAAVIKGFEELAKLKLIDKIPQVVGVQSEGCAPIARAYRQGMKTIEPWENPDTIAQAISNPGPPSGNRVLRKLLDEGRGDIVTVSDEDILAAQLDLASKEGIFAQPAGAVPIAALKQLATQQQIPEGATVVSIITGLGIKDLSVVHQLAEQVGTLKLSELREKLVQ